MDIKKILRKIRLLRTVYYKLQFNKEVGQLPDKDYDKNVEIIKSLKGAYKGKRCFIIGNGPSLTADDLDKLKGEYTFSSNRIFKIYNQTEWRPTFYCCQDGVVLDSIIQELNDVLPQSKYAFISTTQYQKYHSSFKDLANLLWMPLRYVPPRKNIYRFSECADKQIFEGLTVTYSCMQLAAYMGFSEIYLLGVDHNYPIEFDADGNIMSENKDVKSYFGGEEAQNVAITPPKVIEMSRAFISANKVSKNRDFTIYNATRGGKLEIFERKNFDEII